MTFHPVELAPFLDPARVVFLSRDITTRRDALVALAEITANGFSAKDRSGFLSALFDREDVATTAIGGGIALPHARLPHLPACLVTIGISQSGIAYDARDGQPVHLILLLAARIQERVEHLRLMATLAERLRRPGLIEQVLAASDGSAVVMTITAA
jgi:mannitol/fructose-specific phosphotransferase system IIA component (Ntr-type)